MKAQSKRLPYALKGCDAIFYSVFRHLDCSIDVRPVIDYNDVKEWDEKLAAMSDISWEDIHAMVPPERASRVGIGLPELKVSEVMCGESLDTVSVSYCRISCKGSILMIAKDVSVLGGSRELGYTLAE